MQLGIDFGTTRTVVAVADRGNFPVVGFESEDGDVHDHFPTVAASDGTELVFGHAALARLEQPGWTGLRSFKRLLARPDAAQRPTVAIGTLQIGLDALVVRFLEAVRVAILEQSTCPVTPGGDEAMEVFVAVPAGASSAQRFLTLEGFRAAGFLVKGLLNEPSAAGIEYAHRYGKSLTSARSKVLVYDLGGGTFDISLVEMSETHHTVLANSGVNDLGGDDFDHTLLEMALAEAGPQTTDPTVLLDRCRLAKEGLNPNSRRVPIDLDDTTVSLETKAFYEAARPLVARSIDAIGEVLEAGEDERFDTNGLAGVYVVGGGSDLPAVSRQLKEVFGRRVKRSAIASAATAVGLAIAASDQAPKVEQRFNRTFGVFREVHAGEDVAFDPILTRGLALSAEGNEWTRRYRPVHNIGHFRFAECTELRDDGTPNGDLTPFGELRIPFDPALRDSALSALDGVAVTKKIGLPVIEERYQVDGDGIVHVRITDLESGWSQESTL